MLSSPTPSTPASPLRDAQVLARHADPRTSEHYDRARGNLDRHGVHFLIANVAGVQAARSFASCVNSAHFDAPRVPAWPVSLREGVRVRMLGWLMPMGLAAGSWDDGTFLPPHND